MKREKNEKNQENEEYERNYDSARRKKLDILCGYCAVYSGESNRFTRAFLKFQGTQA